jgi:hypothetical protein
VPDPIRGGPRRVHYRHRPGDRTVQWADSRAATGRTVNERDAIQNDSGAADVREVLRGSPSGRAALATGPEGASERFFDN